MYARAGYALSRLPLSLSFSFPIRLSPPLPSPVFLALLSLALPHSCHAARISDNRVGLGEKKTPSGSTSWPPRFGSRILLPPSTLFARPFLHQMSFPSFFKVLTLSTELRARTDGRTVRPPLRTVADVDDDDRCTNTILPVNAFSCRDVVGGSVRDSVDPRISFTRASPLSSLRRR